MIDDDPVPRAGTGMHTGSLWPAIFTNVLCGSEFWQSGFQVPDFPL